ncbi:MAG: DUF4373 domain-containing protein [Bacteroidales bacterium]|nr:DUF4373 domain-containing protein [Bacteroidales bacterium]
MKESYYFSHDYNARSDGKLQRLRMRLGLEGLGCFWCIVEMLYEEGGYISCDEYERISFELRCDVQVVKSVAEDFGLFVRKGGWFYSVSVLKRLALRRAKSEQARKAVAVRWAKRAGDGEGARCERGEPSLFEEMQRCERLEDIEHGAGSSSLFQESGEKNDKRPVFPEHRMQLERRKAAFYEACLAYTAAYGEKMVRDFFCFWSEANTSFTKMRFELERTWELQRRFALWAGRRRRQEEQDMRIGQRLLPDEEERMKILAKIGF